MKGWQDWYGDPDLMPLGEAIEKFVEAEVVVAGLRSTEPLYVKTEGGDGEEEYDEVDLNDLDCIEVDAEVEGKVDALTLLRELEFHGFAIVRRPPILRERPRRRKRSEAGR